MAPKPQRKAVRMNDPLGLWSDLQADMNVLGQNMLDALTRAAQHHAHPTNPPHAALSIAGTAERPPPREPRPDQWLVVPTTKRDIANDEIPGRLSRNKGDRQIPNGKYGHCQKTKSECRRNWPNRLGCSMLNEAGQPCLNWVCQEVNCCGRSGVKFRTNPTMKWACELMGYSHRFLVKDFDEEDSNSDEEEAHPLANKKARATASDAESRQPKKTADTARSLVEEDAVSSPLSTQTYRSDEPDECAVGDCRYRSRPFDDDAISPAAPDGPDLRGIRCSADAPRNGEKRRCRHWSHMACATIITTTKGKGKNKRAVSTWECRRDCDDHDFGPEQEGSNDGTERSEKDGDAPEDVEMESADEDMSDEVAGGSEESNVDTEISEATDEAAVVGAGSKRSATRKDDEEDESDEELESRDVEVEKYGDDRRPTKKRRSM